MITPTSFSVEEDALNDTSAYPITVTLKKLPPPAELANGDIKSGMYRSNLFVDESSTAANDVNGDHSGEEVVKCKYLVGCDGARSWVRKNLGLELKGDSANVYWGAFDAVLDSDLPTTRMKNVVHSADSGSVLMVPREDGMVRVYTQMGTLAPGERVDRDAVTIEKLQEKTQQVLKPFRIDFPYVDWYTCYEIGQRVCDTFSKYDDHILIAGDACHTHSPKAGQGMNVSMMDTFNLGWKLAAVLRGQADPSIVHTYQLERQKTAHQLIEFDRKFSALFSGNAKTAEREGVTPEEMRKAWDDSIRFTSGTGVVYEPNALVGKANPWLAKNITVGSHFENHQVVGAFNAHAIQLQSRLLADGRWRIISEYSPSSCRTQLTCSLPRRHPQRDQPRRAQIPRCRSGQVRRPGTKVHPQGRGPRQRHPDPHRLRHAPQGGAVRRALPPIHPPAHAQAIRRQGL